MARSPETAVLTDSALITLEKARRHIKRLPTDDSADFVLVDLIEQASAAIADYTEREFLPKTPDTDDDDPVARLFRYEADGVLSLAPYEARTITSVLVDAKELLSTQWKAEPRNGTKQGTFLYLTLRLPIPALWKWPIDRFTGYEVTVTGLWGIGTVPAAVERACLITVADWYRNPEGMASRGGELTFTEVSEVDPAARSLPPDARAILSSYRRMH